MINRPGSPFGLTRLGWARQKQTFEARRLGFFPQTPMLRSRKGFLQLEAISISVAQPSYYHLARPEFILTSRLRSEGIKISLDAIRSASSSKMTQLQGPAGGVLIKSRAKSSGRVSEACYHSIAKHPNVCLQPNVFFRHVQDRER
jgi:hypothetical protein